ncbi:hypothetical protein ASFV_Kyiv_2016_131_00120 [African swine fever virus]|uniref:Uncharacterized protein n=1 Tax=African swine fever virus TaxID=10497 RepID=A0A5B8XD99_ASF|nr:hypothetical protein ASFV_Kyiv_2016_131_00120 [African swine fever virus]
MNVDFIAGINNLGEKNLYVRTVQNILSKSFHCGLNHYSGGISCIFCNL